MHVIRPAAAADNIAILTIFDITLGPDFVTASELAPFTAGTGICFVAEIDGSIIGAATATAHDALKMLPRDARSHVQRMLPAGAEPLGLLKTCAVLPQFRNSGIGGRLVQARLGALHDAGRQHVLAICWLRDGVAASEGPLRHAGFSALGDVPEFWTSEAQELGYGCAECGSPCSCSARVMHRKPRRQPRTAAE